MEKTILRGGIQLSINVQMGLGSPVGTSKQGYMPYNTHYEEIVKVFGLPQVNEPSKDGKVTTMWIGKVSGLQFTIYDYKEDKQLADIRDWHIGGQSELTAELVRIYFNSKQNGIGEL